MGHLKQVLVSILLLNVSRRGRSVMVMKEGHVVMKEGVVRVVSEVRERTNSLRNC